MHIATFTRMTPDPAQPLRYMSDGTIDWQHTPFTLNRWDTYALAANRQLARQHSGNSTVITLGPRYHEAALRYALASGFEYALHLVDETPLYTNSLYYATCAAAVIRTLNTVQLITLGQQADDVDTDQHNYQLARKLGWPLLNRIDQILEVNPHSGYIRAACWTDHARQIVRCTLPAVLVISPTANTPPYPTFQNQAYSQQAHIDTWPIQSLQIPMPPMPIPQQQPVPRPALPAAIMTGTPEEQIAQLIRQLEKEQVL